MFSFREVEKGRRRERAGERGGERKNMLVQAQLCHGACVEVSGQLHGCSSLLPPYVDPGGTHVLRLAQPALLSTEPSPRPRSSYF